MHRIPRGRNDSNSPRPVVFLMHGLFSSSQVFIAIGPKNGVAYNLADAGFDVWMGNARGNQLSRNHTILNPNDVKEKFQFFDFSYEEIGTTDLAAMVDYALEVSGEKELHYIGHSQGGTVFLVLTSLKKEYNKKIKSAHLLAGVGYQDHFPDKKLAKLALFTDFIYLLAQSLGVVELYPTNKTKTQETESIESDIIETDFCAGDDSKAQLCELLGIPELLSNNDTEPNIEVAGASLKQVAHYGQNIRDRSFRRWNYGALKNFVVYGQLIPPKYNLGHITANVTMHYTIADTMLDERDVLAMAADIPNAKVRKVPKDTFLHGDFVVADDCKELVTDYIIENILRVESNVANNKLTKTQDILPFSDAILKEADDVLQIEPPLQSSSSDLVLSVLLKTCIVLLSMKIFHYNFFI